MVYVDGKNSLKFKHNLEIHPKENNVRAMTISAVSECVDGVSSNPAGHTAHILSSSYITG